MNIIDGTFSVNKYLIISQLCQYEDIDIFIEICITNG